MKRGWPVLSGNLPAPSARYDHVLGTSLELEYTHASWWDIRLRRRTERAALAEIRRLEGVFSTFQPDSELSRWQTRVGVDRAVSDELAEILEAAASWRIKTRGAFDPTVEHWTHSRRPAARAPLWRLQRRREGPSVARKLTRSPIDLDAIAKGYIVDRACGAALRAGRCSNVTLNLGGDIRHIGSRSILVGIGNPRGGAENARPIEFISIRNQGVATSGGFRRGASLAGKWVSHLIDPRTGQPVDHIRSASVVAPTTATADVLATAFSVLQPRESLAIADSIPGVGCLLIGADRARVANATWDRQVVQSPEYRPVTRRQAVAGLFGVGLSLRQVSERAEDTSPIDRSVIPWDERFELAITFTIGDPRGGMAARRPYVVIYIDDADGTPVRTVSLWAQDASWIRQLRRWFRGDRARQSEGGASVIATVTTPTRSPGRYTVVWDGRDDQGELVEQGEYFVCLETIRQGGSDYFTRAPFTFESSAFAAQMEDYGTFRDVQLEFRERD